MTPVAAAIAELQPLLDALCEETITPDQLQRLEELVLMYPEAEAHYIGFMSFHAALIGHVAGLPEPKVKADAKPQAAGQPLAEPSSLRTPPDDSRRRARRRLVVWCVFVGALAALVGSQGYIWNAHTREVAATERSLNEKRAELALVEADKAAAQKEARKHVEVALAAEGEVVKLYRDAHESARKAIEEKDFVVRLTGPAHVQPGAPNKWQIETLRHGAVGRPKKMDVIVKDAKDAELFRQTHDKPVGAATLELTAAFWEQVTPGSELFLEVVAYTDDDRKSVLAERLPLARPVYVTHLVTDKPLYKPGETIRFRSLTLDRSSLKPPQHDLHLIFRLRDPGDAVIPLEAGNGRLLRDLQSVLGPDKQPLRGIGVGEYAIPADAPGGEYKLDLFEISSETGKEVMLETRKFIVNRYVPDTFEKKLEFDGKSYGPGEFVQARIDVSRTAGGPMKDAKANVVAAADGKTFHEQKDAKFVTTTDAGGTKVYLDVRFKLPAEVFDKASPNATLSVNVQDSSDAEAIVRAIPLVTKTLQVLFFPEGGEMIDGVPGRVYFMVRTPIGKPADLKGTITDGVNTVADVNTLTDAESPGVNRGHGVFTLTPKAGAKYFLKIASPNGITAPTPDGWALPAAKPDGVSLTALDAVTPKGGAIRVRLHSASGPKLLHVGAYARGILISHQKVVLEANQPADVSLKGDEAAGGVTRVTVFEEPQGDGVGRAALVPRAERLVFRASGEHLVLNATPDKTRYSPSGKVRLDLSALTEKGTPTPAVLLVGVVNRSVITMADNKQDRLLPTHFLLSGEVKNSAELEHADFLLTDHPQAGIALDLLLGTQGWRRFAEQDVAPPNAADRADVDRMLVAHGQRTTAPLELFKLEEQRVNAEFAPRIEQARLHTAATEAEWNAASPGLVEKLTAARVGVSVAESQKSEAAAALHSYKSWFVTARERLGDAISSALVPALVLIALFIFFMMAMKATADKPAGSGRPFLAFGGAVVVCVIVVAAISTMGGNANSTFSFVGSSIRPPGGGGGNDLAVATRSAPPAPPRENPTVFGLVDPTAAPNIAPPRDKMGVSGGTKWRIPGRVPGTNGLPLNRPGQPTDNLSDLQANKARVAMALRPRVAKGFDGWSVNPTEPAADSTIMGGRVQENLLARTFKPKVQASPPVLPFVVREYAHQRDPALGEVRSDFTETVYWHPVLVLPDSGKASVEFQLSDDIARYQVLVAGHTTDGRIGAITTSIEARKPFSIDPKLPLEISHTDTVDVPLRVTNDSDVRRNVAFTTTATGFKTTGSLQDVIDLAPNAKGRKMLRLNADTLEGSASLLIEGTSIPAAEKDVIRRTIRVVPDGFPGVGSVSDMLEKGKARGTITLPKDVVPGSLRVRLEVYPTSMADLVKGLDGLLREPSGCFEQTSTTNYPNTLILDYMNQTNQTNSQAAAKAKGLLDKGYGRLTSFECKDTPLSTKHGFEWFGAADR